MEYRPIPVIMSLIQAKMLVPGWADIYQIIPIFHANNLYNQRNLRHSQYIDYSVVKHFSICFFIGWHEL